MAVACNTPTPPHPTQGAPATAASPPQQRRSPPPLAPPPHGVPSPILAAPFRRAAASSTTKRRPARCAAPPRAAASRGRLATPRPRPSGSRLRRRYRPGAHAEPKRRCPQSRRRSRAPRRRRPCRRGRRPNSCGAAALRTPNPGTTLACDTRSCDNTRLRDRRWSADTSESQPQAFGKENWQSTPCARSDSRREAVCSQHSILPMFTQRPLRKLSLAPHLVYLKHAVCPRSLRHGLPRERAAPCNSTMSLSPKARVLDEQLRNAHKSLDEGYPPKTISECSP